MLLAGSSPASCSATAPMPEAGRQLDPVASIFITNSNSREVVPRSRSKKMPPRKGRKKRSTMAGEKPSACLAQAFVHLPIILKLDPGLKLGLWNRRLNIQGATVCRDLVSSTPTNMFRQCTSYGNAYNVINKQVANSGAKWS